MPETMLCPNCKSEMPSGLKFCNNYGTNPQEAPSAGNQPEQTKEKQPFKKPKTWMWVLGVLVLCLACLLLIAGLYAAVVKAGVDLPNPFPAKTPLNEEQAIETAWQALDPNTHSHRQTSWEVSIVQIVTGQEVQDQFAEEPAPGCFGPTPPDNASIAPGGTYWYVEMQPVPATPQPEPDSQYSPTAPPNIPEPFVQKAKFLIDAITGQVSARNLFCIIY